MENMELNEEQNTNSMNNEVVKKSKKTNMQMINLIAIAVVFVGLVVLYILHFTGSNSGSAFENPDFSGMSVDGELPPIAYVNNDSLMEKYLLISNLSTRIEILNDSLMMDLQNRSTNIQSRYQTFMENYQTGLLSEQEAQAQEMEFLNEQKFLEELQGDYQEILAKETNSMALNYESSINDFFSRNKAVYPFALILTYTTGGQILYANDSLDITDQLIKSLNTDYIDQK